MSRGGGAAYGGVTAQRHGGGRGGRGVGGQAAVHLRGKKEACHHREDVYYNSKVRSATVRCSGLLETEVAAPGQPW